MNMYESGHPLDGVSCDVKTCAYNKTGKKCTANRIEVANENSTRSADTFCNTFTKK